MNRAAAHVNQMSYAAGFIVFARADLGGWFAPTDTECSASISPADDPTSPADDPDHQPMIQTEGRRTAPNGCVGATNKADLDLRMRIYQRARVPLVPMYGFTFRRVPELSRCVEFGSKFG